MFGTCRGSWRWKRLESCIKCIFFNSHASHYFLCTPTITFSDSSMLAGLRFELQRSSASVASIPYWPLLTHCTKRPQSCVQLLLSRTCAAQVPPISDYSKFYIHMICTSSCESLSLSLNRPSQYDALLFWVPTLFTGFSGWNILPEIALKTYLIELNTILLNRTQSYLIEFNGIKSNQSKFTGIFVFDCDSIRFDNPIAIIRLW